MGKEIDLEYPVYLKSREGKQELFCICPTKKEALDLCCDYDWKYKDEDGFVWRLDFEEQNAQDHLCEYEYTLYVQGNFYDGHIIASKHATAEEIQAEIIDEKVFFNSFEKNEDFSNKKTTYYDYSIYVGGTTHYAYVGVEPDASEDEIKKAIREDVEENVVLIDSFHKVKGDIPLFEKIEEARAVLKTKPKKKEKEQLNNGQKKTKSFHCRA